MIFPHAGLLLPETERLAHQVLALPTGTACQAETITQICAILRLAIANAHQIRANLPAADNSAPLHTAIFCPIGPLDRFGWTRMQPS